MNVFHDREFNSDHRYPRLNMPDAARYRSENTGLGEPLTILKNSPERLNSYAIV
jgi:hypothetical protein